VGKYKLYQNIPKTHFPPFQACLHQCIEQIEDLFISGTNVLNQTSNNSCFLSPSKDSTASTDSGMMLLSSPEQPPLQPQQQLKRSLSKSPPKNSSQDQNQTPTEVFKASAFCVA
jgi:hypothetical protein